MMKKLICLLMLLLLTWPTITEAQQTLPLCVTRNGEIARLAVPAESIAQRGPTAEEIAAEWRSGEPAEETAPATGLTWRCEAVFAPHETLGFRAHEVSLFSRYDGESCLWTTEIRDYQVRGWQEVREGVLLWGYTDAYGWPTTAGMTLLSHEGAVLWTQPLSPRIGWEQTAAVIDGGDGVYTAFSTCNISRQDVLTVRRISADGRLLSCEETPAAALGLTGGRQRFHIQEALALEEGWLLHLTSGTRHLLAQHPAEGRLRQMIVCDAADGFLTLTDMLYHGGSLWLSGYLTPGEADSDYFASVRNEIDDVWDALYLFPVAGPVNSEFLVPRVRACYTAVLLRVDPAGFLPLQAYTVEGCMGGRLAQVQAGVTWDVESVTSCFYSPLTSSFTIGGVARVFRYAFAADGALLGGGETQELAVYRR